MNFLIYENANGKPKALLDTTDVSGAIANTPDNYSYVSADFVSDVNAIYVEGGRIYTKKDKPTVHHAFNYETKQWEDTRTPDTEWQVVRIKRNQLLSGTDWAVTRATEAGQAVPLIWQTYRQALRDVTLQPDPFNIVWPTPPN